MEESKQVVQIPQASQNHDQSFKNLIIKHSDILDFEESKEQSLNLMYKRYDLSEGNQSDFQMNDPNKPFSQVKDLNSIRALKPIIKSKDAINSQNNSSGFMMSGQAQEVPPFLNLALNQSQFSNLINNRS